MKSIREIELRTRAYSFTIEVFEISDGEEFVATINGFTPPLAQEVQPGDGLTYLTSIEEEKFRDTNQEALIEHCRARIIEIGGDILMERG